MKRETVRNCKQWPDDWLERLRERAAIMEFEAGLTTGAAEELAARDVCAAAKRAGERLVGCERMEMLF